MLRLVDTDLAVMVMAVTVTAMARMDTAARVTAVLRPLPLLRRQQLRRQQHRKARVCQDLPAFRMVPVTHASRFPCLGPVFRGFGIWSANELARNPRLLARCRYRHRDRLAVC